MPNALMYRLSEEAETDKEQHQGDLEEHGKRRGDFEQLPILKPLSAKMTDPKTFLQRGTVDREVLAEPLFDEDAV